MYINDVSEKKKEKSDLCIIRRIPVSYSCIDPSSQVCPDIKVQCVADFIELAGMTTATQ